MIISVYSPKGGVGKTSLSLNLSSTLDFTLLSNDEFGGVTDLVNKGRRRNKAFLVGINDEEILKQNNSVYDFGGFRDNRVKKILSSSNVVIIPTLHSHSDIKATLSTIIELNKINQKNIIIAVNRVTTNSSKKNKQGLKIYTEFLETKTEIKDFLETNNLPKVKFIQIRDNKAWRKSTSKGRSLIELAEKNKLVKHSSKSAIEDLVSLINAIKKFK